MKSLHVHRSRGASSLIVTLLVIVVLSTIVVAFMQSMSVERMSAKSIKNTYQAKLAAEAGVAEAINNLSALMASNPYHAIGYTNINNVSVAGSPTSQIVTMLYGTNSTTNTPTAYYLMSSTNGWNTVPAALNATNSTAINLKTAGGSGWVGSPVTAAGAITNRECRAPWIYILDKPSQPHQPNPAAANYNPYVARYAYWIEDETSKLDFRVAGNNLGPANAFRRSTNSAVPSEADLGAAPLVNGTPITNASVNNQLITFRNTVTNLPVDGRIIGQAPGVSTNAEETSRFYTTMSAYSSELTVRGTRRANINAIVNDATSATAIAANLNDIIYAITGTHDSTLKAQGPGGLFNSLPTNTNAPSPTFGTRFYANASVADQAIYLKKLAANIRDYIDADSQPTLVNSTGTVVSGTVPASWWNNWPPQALGKEAIPYLQETAWTGYEVGPFTGSGSSRTGTVEIDHYLEFLNPSTKDFVAPAGTVITISNMTTWSAGIYPPIAPADFQLDISNVVFPAGKATVITTAPADPPGLIVSGSTIRIQPAVQEGTRRFTNRLTDNVISGSIGFQCQSPNSRSSNVSDVQSRLIMSGTGGVYDALQNYGFTATGTTPWNFKGQNSLDRSRFIYGTSLVGNLFSGSPVNGRSGDPRTLSEQLQFVAFASSNQDNTRFYGTIQGNGVSANATLGKAAAPATFVDPTRAPGTTGAWGDYNPFLTDSASTAYAVIRDSPMLSIGELGNIFDPYRLSAPTGIQGARGGGRSLKIGQQDDVIGPATRFSGTWQNAAWRLTDTFGVDSDRTKTLVDAQSRGKLNINSVQRDGGTVLRALLRSFTFLSSPDGDSVTSGTTLSNDDIDNATTGLITSLKSYITANGPIMERGELSQISFFSPSATKTLAGTAARIPTMNDRGREEIFRRLTEMVTTRSSSYSVFSIGEAIREDANGNIKRLAKSRQGSIYRFDPVFGPIASPITNPILTDRATTFTPVFLYERP